MFTIEIKTLEKIDTMKLIIMYILQLSSRHTTSVTSVTDQNKNQDTSEPPLSLVRSEDSQNEEDDEGTLWSMNPITTPPKLSRSNTFSKEPAC